MAVLTLVLAVIVIASVALFDLWSSNELVQLCLLKERNIFFLHSLPVETKSETEPQSHFNSSVFS